jgi:hypothetical protein
MTCELVKQQLPLLVYGELSFDEEEAIQQHLERCASCQVALTATENIHRSLDAHELQPVTDLLIDCRRNLRAQIAAVDEGRRTKARLSGLFSGTWNWFVRPLGAFALVAIGFFGARFVSPENTQVRGRGYDQVASRVRFVEPEASGQVRIVLEEVRQRTLSGGMEEEPIRRLLLAAARDASDPGVRVGSMDLLKSRPESEVRRALLHALRSDSNAGVRLKALEGLRGAPIDAELARVLSEVLLTDSNPGLRTQAIDLLIQRKEPAMVGVLQEVIAKEDNSYVRMRCQNALKDMNASVESF